MAEYFDAVSIELKKAGSPARESSHQQAATPAQSGEKPAGGAVRQVKLTATVEAIDQKKPSATLKAPKGQVVEVRVRDPKVLTGVKPGDQVDVTYTEAVAIAVEPAPKK